MTDIQFFMLSVCFGVCLSIAIMCLIVFVEEFIKWVGRKK